MVALDPLTGFVKACRGPNFRYFKYDMAKQGKRQRIGSTIKPFVLLLSPSTTWGMTAR